MTAPYYPDLSWGQSVAEREPKKQDTLALVLGNRFQQPQGAQPQTPWGQFRPQQQGMQQGGQRQPQGAWPQSRQAGAPQPAAPSAAPPGSTPMMAPPALSRVNPFRPQPIAQPVQATPFGPPPQLSQGTTGGNGYQFDDQGRMTSSNYGRDMSGTRGYQPAQEGQPLQPITEYDYSDERSHNDYADLSDEEYRALQSDPNVRDNFVSYVDPETGETRWQYYTGGAGRSYDEVYREGVYSINQYGQYVNDAGEPVQVGGQWGVPNPTAAGYNPLPNGMTPGSGTGNPTHNATTDGGGYAPGTRPPRDPNTLMGGRGTYSPFERGATDDGITDVVGGGGMNFRTGPPPPAPQDRGTTRMGDAVRNAGNNTRTNTNYPAGDPRNTGYTPPPPVPSQTPSSTPTNRNDGPMPGPYDPGPRYVPPQSGGPTAGDAGAPWDDALNSSITSGLLQPSRWDEPLLRRTWEGIAGDLDSQFDDLNQGLVARLAQQGIRDSTFGGQEQQRLAGERRTAKSRALQALEEDVANTMSMDRSRSIGDALAAAARRSQDQQFGLDYELRRMFGLDDRAYRDRESQWQHGFDEENFNADQQKWMDQFYQWMVERGLA